jgi:hypothetical protein
MATATDKELKNKQLRCRVLIVCYSYICRGAGLTGDACDQLDVYLQMVRILSCICTEGERLRSSLNLSCIGCVIRLCSGWIWEERFLCVANNEERERCVSFIHLVEEVRRAMPRVTS